VAIHRNPVNARRTGGWQLTPVFQVYQHEEKRALLEDIAALYGCGTIWSKGPKSSVLTYSVSRLDDLEIEIVPFFERYPLRVKAGDFERFATIVRWMRAKKHLSPDGFERAVRLAYEMNAHGKQRSRSIDEILQGSSETVRQAPRWAVGDETVRAAWRHAESGRNDLAPAQRSGSNNTA
jgi:hypothetical protein